MRPALLRIEELERQAASKDEALLLLQQRVEQMEGSIEALQEANRSKQMQLMQLKRDAQSTEARVNKLKECFTCSISHDLMQKPCLLSTGQLFNSDSIRRWLWCSGSEQCPNTRRRLEFHDQCPPVCTALNEVCAILAEM